jgi:hypothetical protein
MHIHFPNNRPTYAIQVDTPWGSTLRAVKTEGEFLRSIDRDIARLRRIFPLMVLHLTSGETAAWRSATLHGLTTTGDHFAVTALVPQEIPTPTLDTLCARLERAGEVEHARL